MARLAREMGRRSLQCLRREARRRRRGRRGGSTDTLIALGPRMKNIVVLISGRGSNMESIVQACATEVERAHRGGGQQPARRRGPGLARARGIATAVVDHRGHASRERSDAELQRTIDAFAPDLLVLAGFMRILTPGFVVALRRAFAERCTVAAARLHGPVHAPACARSRLPLPARRCTSSPLATSTTGHHRAGRGAGAARRQRGDARCACSARARALSACRAWFVDDLLRVEGSAVRHVRGEPQLLLA